MAEQRKRQYEPRENDVASPTRLRKLLKDQKEQRNSSTSTRAPAGLSHAYEIGAKTPLPTKTTIENWRQKVKSIVPISPIERCARGEKGYILAFPEDEELRREARDRVPPQAWFGRFRKHLDRVGAYKRKMQEFYPTGRGSFERVFRQWNREQNTLLAEVERDVRVKIVHAWEEGARLGLSFSTTIGTRCRI